MSGSEGQSCRLGPRQVKSRSSSLQRIPAAKPGSFLPQRLRAVEMRKAGLLDRAIHVSKQNTWLNPLLLVSSVVMAYAIDPEQENPVYGLLFVSYPIKSTSPQLYGKGPIDILFVLFYVVVFTLSREFVMTKLLEPIGRSYGLRTAKLQRFMEQGYSCVYFSFVGCLGVVCFLSHSNVRLTG